MLTQLSIQNKLLSLDLDEDQPSQKIIYDFLRHGCWYEQATVKELIDHLQPGQTFVDVGAHVGYFSVIGASLVGETGAVDAFEPSVKNFCGLIHNISINDYLGRVTTHNVAVRNLCGFSLMHFNRDNDGGHAFWDVGKHPANPLSKELPLTESICTVKLDNFGFQNVGAIKIDVEGSEFEVLSGAHDTMMENPDAIVICEINPFGLYQLGHNEKHIRDYMRDLGYQEPVILAEGDYDPKYVFNLMFKR